MARVVNLLEESSNSILDMTKEEQEKNIYILPEILQKHPEELEHVDKDILKRHDELYLAAVSADQFAISKVPPEVQLRHPEMPLSAIRKTPTLLRYLPEQIMKDNLKVLETCAFNVGSCIEYIPASVAALSDRIYDNAVRSDGMSLEFIPFDIQLQRPDLVASALKDTPASGQFANPKVFEVSKEACLAAVRSDGMNLSLIPAAMQSAHEEIISEAMSKTRNAIIYAEPGFQAKNLGILRSVLRNHPDRIEDLSWDLLSAHPDLIETAVKKDGLLLELFPEEYLNDHPRIADAAIRQNGAAVYFTSASMQDKVSGAIVYALSKNPYMLSQIDPGVVRKHPEFTVQYRRSRVLSMPEVSREEMSKLGKDVADDNDILICLEADPCQCAGILQEKKSDIKTIIERIQNGKILPCLPDNEKIRFILNRMSSLLKEDFLPKAQVLDVLMRLPEDKFKLFDKKKWFRIAQNPIWERDPITLRSLMLLSFACGMYESDPRLSSKGQSFMESITRMRNIFTIDIPNPDSGDLPKEVKDLIKKAADNGIIEVANETYRWKLIHCPQSKSAERAAEIIWRDKALSCMIVKGKNTDLSNKKDGYQKLKKAVLEDIKKTQFPETVFESEESEILYGEDNIQKAYSRALLSGAYEKENTHTLICRVKPNLSRKQNAELCALLNAIPQDILTYNGITAQKLHQMADSVLPEYASSFTAFLSGHREKLLEYGCDISYIQRVFPSASKRYMDDARHHMRKGRLIPPEKMTFKELIRYTTPGSYNSPQGVDPDVLFNASFVCNLYNYSQKDFEKVCDLAQQAANRTASSIPQVEGECGAYRYKVIPLSDISALQFGMKLSCCQQLSGAGESCMIHSMTSVNGRVLYLYDSDERAVFGSWIWRNGEVLCADNIEGRSRTIGGDHVIQADVMDCYKDWARKEIAASQEAETETRGILRVTFGSGYSDLSTSGFEPDRENRFPLERVEYIHDSRNQFVIASADEDTIREKRRLPDETPCIYEDNPEITPLFQPEVAETYAYAGEGGRRENQRHSEAQEHLHMTDLEDPSHPGIPTIMTDRQIYGFKKTSEAIERARDSRIQAKNELKQAKKAKKTR